MHPNVEIIFNAVPQEIVGKEFVTGIKYLEGSLRREEWGDCRQQHS